MRFLLVEDYTDLRKGLRVALEREGHAVVEAADGREAMDVFDREAAAGRTFDVAVVDYNLPHFKGDAVADHITRTAHDRGVPVPDYVALTGSQDSQMVGRLQTAGVYELIIKGGDFGRLLDRVCGRRLRVAA
jgi:DNA-binding response OmpR family regulator